MGYEERVQKATSLRQIPTEDRILGPCKLDSSHLFIPLSIPERMVFLEIMILVELIFLVIVIYSFYVVLISLRHN